MVMYKLDERDLIQRMSRAVQELAKQAQRIISVKAKDTGDMERAVTYTDPKKVNGVYEAEVFVNRNKLADIRKDKKVNRKYPIYVHNGYEAQTVTVNRNGKSYDMNIPARKAIPFFDMAYKQMRKKYPHYYNGLTKAGV